MQEVWEIITEEDDKIIDNEEKEAILVIGVEGSGKTQTTLLLTDSELDKKSTTIRPDFKLKTSIPKMIMGQNQTVYYDCPSFGGGYDAPSDMMSTHSMKKLMKQLFRVKFLVTIQYSFVARINQLDKFMNWIRKIQRVMKDIKTFQNNISLVVTRVDTSAEISDEQIITEIKHFLETVKVFIVKNVTDWKYQNYAINFINIFLFDDGNCKKLNILREFEEIDSILYNEKLLIQRTLENCVEFTNTNDGFDYHVSELTENYINLMVDRFHSNTASALKTVSANILKHFDHREQQYSNIYDLEAELKQGWNQTNQIFSKIQNFHTFRDLGNQLKTSLETMKVFIAGEEISIFFIQDRYIEFLRDVSSRELKVSPWKFQPEISTIVKHLYVLKTFYRLFNETYLQLSGYLVQARKKNKLNVKQLVLELKKIIHSGHKVLEKCFKYLWKEIIGEIPSKILDYMKIIEPLPANKSRWISIIELLRSTLESDDFHSEPSNGELFISGSYLRTKNINWAQLAEKNITSVKIFARKKIFLDHDLLLATPGLNVTMIAPIWEVMETRKINFRWFAFEPNVKLGFLAIGNFVRSEGLTIDGRSVWLAKDKRVLKDVHLIDLDGGSIKYENVKPSEKSKMCELKFHETLGIHSQNYSSVENWKPQEFVIDNINEYKFYLMQNLQDRMAYKETQQMFLKLNKNPCIDNLYNARGFVNELLSLETRFQWSRRHEFIPLYESLKNRVEAHKGVIKSDGDIAWLVYRTAASKLWSLKNNLSNDVIIHIERKIDTIMKDIKKLNEKKKIESIDDYADNFGEKIKKQSEGMLKHIQESILPEIDLSMERIERKTAKLKEEVDEYIKTYEEHREKMKREREKFKTQAILGFFASLLKGLGMLMSLFTGPAAPIVGAVLLGAGSIMEKFTPKAEEPSISAQLPTGAQGIEEKMTTQSENWNNKQMENNKKALRRAIQVIDIGVRNSRSKRDYFLNTIKEVRRLDFEKATEMLQKERDRVKIMGKVQKGEMPVYIILDRALLATVSLDMVIQESEIRYELNNNDKYSSSIAEDTRNLETMKLMRKQIQENLTPALKRTHQFLGKASASIDKDNRVTFNEQQYKIKKVIRNMQEQMRELMTGFKSEEGIKNAWDQLKDVMEQLINIYNQIHDSKDRCEMIVAIGDMNKAGIKGYTPKDKQLGKSLETIERSFLNNLIIGEYYRLLDALKLSTFPFVSFYLNPERMIINTNPNEDMSEMVERKLKSLRSSFVEYRSTVVAGYDDHLREAHFSSRKTLKNPFYLWKNKYHKRTIEKLLSGKPVFLVADLLKGRPENAVKFNRLEFLIKAKDKKIQKEIDEILEKYRISLTHLGVSRYKCDHKVYVIVSNPVKLDFSFTSMEIQSDEPLVQSSSTKKLGTIPILSPYATWNVSLVQAAKDALGFDALKNYSKHLDLELGGHGSYVVENSKVCDDHLERHYKVDRTVPLGTLRSQSWNRHRRSVIQNESSFATDFKNCSFPNINGTMFLFDCLVRKCTGLKIKPLYTEYHDKRIQDATITSLESTRKFEASLKKLVKEFYPEDMELVFDPCVLIGQLKSKLLRNELDKIDRVMFNYVVHNNPSLNATRFVEKLQDLAGSFNGSLE